VVEVRVESLVMSDGSDVVVPADGVVVFVGPNNAGKSVSLRDIDLLLTRTAPDEAKAVKVLNIAKTGTQEEFEEWLDRNTVTENRLGSVIQTRVGASEQHRTNLVSWWNAGPPFQHLASYFRFYGGAENRLQASNGAGQIDYTIQSPVHPLHHLYLDRDLEARVSTVSTTAFGTPVFLNRYAGSQVYLHSGAPPEGVEQGVPSKEYLAAVSRVPRLQDQGDGMRSFVGVILNLVVANYFCILLDEPEAFLHPPQAHLLGRLLGELKSPGAQLFLATHDSDVLRGLLDSPAKEITVVRLVRDGDVNRTSQVDPAAVRELWRDPLLRYSNVLDGLFHQAVVLCEADADCRFYASVLDVLLAEEDAARRPELLWTHSGGKHRMPVVVRALRAVRVPVIVISDFDILREEQPLRDLVESLGGDWDVVEPLWRPLKASLESESRPLEGNYVRQELEKRAAAIPDGPLSREDQDAIRALTRSDSTWDRAKRAGIEAVPHGEARERAEELLARLRTFGLFVVDVGELEGFAPAVGQHGTAWVADVHERGLHRSEEIDKARRFVKDVATAAIGEWPESPAKGEQEKTGAD
jgi:hypothetical protein